MPRWLEFHDSDLVDIATAGRAVTVRLRAYIHDWEESESGWAGTGWMQPVEILLRGSASATAALSGEIWNGWLKFGDDNPVDLVPLPFASDRPTHLHIELNAGSIVDIHAQSISVDPTGEPTFVERLRDDMRPDAG